MKTEKPGVKRREEVKAMGRKIDMIIELEKSSRELARLSLNANNLNGENMHRARADAYAKVLKILQSRERLPAERSGK